MTMRSSSSSDVASRGIAKLSASPSAGAVSRNYLVRKRVSTEPSPPMQAATTNTGRSAAITASMYS